MASYRRSVIKTLPTNAHGMTQVIGRCSVIALLPEHNFRRLQCVRTIKFLGRDTTQRLSIMDNNVKYYAGRWSNRNPMPYRGEIARPVRAGPKESRSE